MVGLSGVIVTDFSEVELTIVTVVVPVMPFRVADTGTGPVLPLIRSTPLLLIIALLGEPVRQLSPLSGIVLPSLNVPVAVNWTLARVGITGLPGDTMIETRADELTLRVAEPLTFWNTAVICAVPMLRAFAKPVLLIRATLAEEDIHWACAVTSCVLPSAKPAVAVYCCVPPIPIDLIAGVTEIDVGVPSTTVTLAVAETPLYVAVMVD